MRQVPNRDEPEARIAIGTRVEELHQRQGGCDRGGRQPWRTARAMAHRRLRAAVYDGDRLGAIAVSGLSGKEDGEIARLGVDAVVASLG